MSKATASVKAIGPMPKARSTMRASPRTSLVRLKIVNSLWFQAGDDMSSIPNAAIINFNWEYTDGVYFIDQQTASTFEISATRAIVHEITHCLTLEAGPNPADYATPGTDYFGPVVDLENTIMTDLGEPFVRASYFSTITKEQLASLDLDLGEPFGGSGFAYSIGFALVDQDSRNLIDTSDRSEDVLLVGLNGNDDITSGRARTSSTVETVTMSRAGMPAPT